jgi:hypothetical protein
MHLSIAILLAACTPLSADVTATSGEELEALDAFEGEEELDGPGAPTDTVPDGVQIPWVGPVAPGLVEELNEVTVSQVVPGNRIFLLLAPEGGSFTTPDCGLVLDLDDPQLLGIVEGNNAGVATFQFTPDASVADQPLVFQAVDLESCVVSALSDVTFKDLSGPGTTTPGTGSTTPGTTPGTVPGTTTPGTPGTTPVPQGSGQTCYPGDRSVYDVCVTLDEAGTQGADYVYPSSSSSNYAAPTHLLYLADIPGSVLVAPNFRRDELAQEWKGDWGVVQVHAVERLQDLRDDLGPLVVNSGYRSPAYNASVGGATLSRHMYGDAFDLDPVNVSLTDLESACYAHGAGFVSVYVSHVHCDWRNDAQEDAFYGPPAPPPPLGGTASSWSVPRPAVRLERVGSWLEAPVVDGFECGEPLREWVAYDAEDHVIAVGEGPSWEPPVDAVAVEVTVGRVVTERIELP